eukprot:TRINITY_DN17503_c0_g1_i1.p1 TRINITY_DN17503_c0_g1~~TRINITY_DN17503_c0_g1_i1.p1  ORF type:complete len:151 (-),score=9.70 TRINITY_DN17503_c0_g1_i1:356-808(-)
MSASSASSREVRMGRINPPEQEHQEPKTKKWNRTTKWICVSVVVAACIGVLVFVVVSRMSSNSTSDIIETPLSYQANLIVDSNGTLTTADLKNIMNEVCNSTGLTVTECNSRVAVEPIEEEEETGLNEVGVLISIRYLWEQVPFLGKCCF